MLWILQLMMTWSMLLASGSAISLTLTLAPSSVVGGNSATGTITLSTAAPVGGVTVTVTNPPGTTVQAGAAQVGIQQEGSTKIAIAGGARTVSFRVNTAGVAASTTATLNATSGTDATSANLTILPASIRAVTITPVGVVGGQSVSAQIALDGAAAIGTGTTVQLAASSSARDGSILAVGDGSVRAIGGVSAATAPATAHFPPGSRSITVPVTTSPVPTDQSGLITATLGASTASGSFVISAPVVTSLSLNPSTVVSGSSTTGTVTLNGPAPAQAAPILLSSNNTIVTVPASVTVSAGSSQQTFQVTTAAATVGATVTIATRRVREAASRISDGTSNTIQIGEAIPAAASATLTLLPAPVIATFTLRPTKVKGGANVIAEIQLLPGVTSAQTITLTTDRTDVQLPATVSVPASGVPTPFTITTHDVNEKVIATITATAGTQSIAVSLTINK
jgi:hypothetical protein